MDSSKAVKVLYLGDRPSGGAGESLFQIVHSRPKESSVIFFSEDGFLGKRFESLNLCPPPRLRYTRSWVRYLPKGSFPLSWLRFLLSFFWHFFSVLSLYWTARKEKVRLIHTNTINCIDGAIVSKLLRIPHIFHLRELIDVDYYQYDLSKPSIIRWLSKLGDLVLCNSHRTARGLISLGMPSGQVRTIYNFVEEPLQQESLHDYLKLDRRIRIIGTCGWITPNKRVEDFISMAKRLGDLGNEFRFVILGAWGGQPDYNSKIERAISDSGISDRIIVTGILPHASRYFSSMEVFVCASFTESFGRVVAEALAAGTPSIGVKETAVDELILHEESGYLVEMGDPAAMETFVRKIVQDTELRKRMNASAKESMKKLYPSELMPTLENLYHDMIKKKSC